MLERKRLKTFLEWKYRLFVSEQQFYIAISKQSPMAKKVSQINNILGKLKENGEINQILKST